MSSAACVFLFFTYTCILIPIVTCLLTTPIFPWLVNYYVFSIRSPSYCYHVWCYTMLLSDYTKCYVPLIVFLYIYFFLGSTTRTDVYLLVSSSILLLLLCKLICNITMFKDWNKSLWLWLWLDYIAIFCRELRHLIKKYVIYISENPWIKTSLSIWHGGGLEGSPLQH